MARTKKDEYTRLADRAKAGHYELVEPLDFMILDKLPKQGELFAGLYPLGETVRTLVKKFDNPHVKNTMVTQRLRTMHLQGLAHKTLTGVNTGGNSVWQITEAGQQLLDTWKKNQGESNGTRG